MTSNLGSQYLLEGISESGEISDGARESVMALLKETFRPEFLNRLDETVVFKPLGKSEIHAIVRLMLEELEARLRDRGLKLTVDDAAVDLIVARGYDPIYGARPIKRRIQSDLETPIARAIIMGDFGADATVSVSVEQGEFAITVG